jgi:hypothetical protein
LSLRNVACEGSSSDERKSGGDTDTNRAMLK